jgi:nitronate monooxygenase
MLQTRLTALLGIRYPVISAPMARMSGGHLAAAVSMAGGLGTFGGITTATPTGPDYIREQIRYIRSQTDQPFGVGFITQFLPLAPQNFDTVLEEKVPVVLFSFADPRPWVRRAKEHGTLTVCQVQTLQAARLAVAAGADILAAQGNEAGGHTGAIHLLPFLVQLIEEFPAIPVIAAGGIANGRSLAAVLAAGAEGAWVGTAPRKRTARPPRREPPHVCRGIATGRPRDRPPVVRPVGGFRAGSASCRRCPAGAV